VNLDEALGQLVDALAIDGDKAGIRLALVDAAAELDERTAVVKSRLVTHTERIDRLTADPAKVQRPGWFTRARWRRSDRRAE
jgi:hypothetical protein